jgi:hypothetical protein
MNERVSIGAGVSTGFPGALFEFCKWPMLEDGPRSDAMCVQNWRTGP